ncbi:DUF3592 domain-containing protein [Paludisphaera sp.]|uniref:DUF3592 domain-containing protein n=1 Tax=Paludisphaera sp. TaxID=2017432 RepID=UPI00301DBB66
MLSPYLNAWLLAVALSFFLFAYLLEEALDHLWARRWPRTTGKVVESTVEERRGESGLRGSFTPRIRFVYDAAGKAWESRQFAFHVWAGSRGRAESTVARYPVGSVVTVYFHPDRPENAVLEPAKAWLSVAVAAWFGLIFLVSVAAWLGASRAAA